MKVRAEGVKIDHQASRGLAIFFLIFKSPQEEDVAAGL